MTASVKLSIDSFSKNYQSVLNCDKISRVWSNIWLWFATRLGPSTLLIRSSLLENLYDMLFCSFHNHINQSMLPNCYWIFRLWKCCNYAKKEHTLIHKGLNHSRGCMHIFMKLDNDNEICNWVGEGLCHWFSSHLIYELVLFVHAIWGPSIFPFKLPQN